MNSGCCLYVSKQTFASHLCCSLGVHVAPLETTPLVPEHPAWEARYCGSECQPLSRLRFTPQGEESLRILVPTEGESLPLMDINTCEVSLHEPLLGLVPRPHAPTPCTRPALVASPGPHASFL